MFRKFLEQDLIAIFEKEQVDFSNNPAHFQSELDVLFVLIDPDGVKNNCREGENYFSVIGTLEFVEDKTQTNFGFFNQRMMLSRFKPAGTLRLLGREGSETLANDQEQVSDRILIKKSQKFSYRISIPFNKPIGDIEGLELEAEMQS